MRWTRRSFITASGVVALSVGSGFNDEPGAPRLTVVREAPVTVTFRVSGQSPAAQIIMIPDRSADGGARFDEPLPFFRSVSRVTDVGPYLLSILSSPTAAADEVMSASVSIDGVVVARTEVHGPTAEGTCVAFPRGNSHSPKGVR